MSLNEWTAPPPNHPPPALYGLMLFRAPDPQNRAQLMESFQGSWRKMSLLIWPLPFADITVDLTHTNTLGHAITNRPEN